MIERRPKNKYSSQFILVCNIPEEKLANPSARKIIHGIRTKWSQQNDDPECKRLHIIYLADGDTPENPKFAVLNNADRMSRVYIVGHCAPGSEYIYSDNIYIDKKDKNKTIRCKFSFVDLARILLLNISNPEIRVDRDEGFHLLMAKSRKLKICLMGCDTALDVKTITGTIISKSFSSLFIEALHNTFNMLFVCDVVGVSGYMLPIAAKPDFFNYLKYVLDLDYEPGFHKRYMHLPYHKGNINLSVFNFEIAHKPVDEYKIVFVPSPRTTATDVIEQDIKYIELDRKEAKYRDIEQENGEIVLGMVNHILNNKRLYALHKDASLILHGIVTGRISNEQLIQSFDVLMEKLNNQFAPPSPPPKPSQS
jgi:hypothetical protein